MKHFVLILFAGALSSCATTTLLPVADGVSRKLDGYAFEIDMPGRVGVEVAAPGCGQLTNRGLLRLRSDDGYTSEVVPACKANDRAMFAEFAKEALPGTYKLDVRDEGSLRDSMKGPLRGQVLFTPQEPEKKSGPDQAYLGATPIADGVQSSTLSIASGDRTDWWLVSQDAFANVSIFFQHNVDSGLIQAQVYRLNGTHLVLRQHLPANAATVIGMEGPHYIKVFSAPFAPNASYSLAIKRSDTKAPTGGAAAPTPLAILESWPIEDLRSAVLLNAGTAQELKVGDMIKLFSNNQFLDVCRVVGVGLNESECHVDKMLKGKRGLTARRSF